MVCAGVPRLLLVSLLFSGISSTEQKTLDQNTLVPVIKFLRQNYQPSSTTQYAIAFNAPADKCADYLDNNFLSAYPANNVKNAINSAERLYKGQRLIAARPKPIPGTRNNQHSEYLLMKLPTLNTAPMTELLNTDNSGCVVFYTYNSPCTSTCSNPRNCYNILDALNKFKAHSGPKAFVFTEVWMHDCDRDISSNLREIIQRVPLYRCTGDNCVACTESNLNVACRCD